MPERVIADLTIDEFRALIASVVDDRMRYWRQPEPVIDKVALKKTFESIDRHMWTPPPGAGRPGVVEMLREDRDR